MFASSPVHREIKVLLPDPVMPITRMKTEFGLQSTSVKTDMNGIGLLERFSAGKAQPVVDLFLEDIGAGVVQLGAVETRGGGSGHGHNHKRV